MSTTVQPLYSEDTASSFRDLIHCPILFDTTTDMIFFNHHFYDRHVFEVYKTTERNKNLTRTTDRLKDPRTGVNYAFNYANSNLFYCPTIPRIVLQTTITNRVRSLPSNQIDEFLPSGDGDCNINEFVAIVAAKFNVELRTPNTSTPIPPFNSQIQNAIDVNDDEIEEIVNELEDLSEDEDDAAATLTNTTSSEPSSIPNPTIESTNSPPETETNPPPATRRRVSRRIPHFVNTSDGQSICVSILSFARAEGFQVTLMHPNRLRFLT